MVTEAERQALKEQCLHKISSRLKQTTELYERMMLHHCRVRMMHGEYPTSLSEDNDGKLVIKFPKIKKRT